LVPEDQLGVLQASAVRLGFEVEEDSVAAGGERSGQCRLAALAGPQESGDGGSPDRAGEQRKSRRPVDHENTIS
jgi:hypothetical protein